MLLYSIVCNIFSMTSFVGLADAGYKRLCELSIRSVTVSVGFSVMLNVADREDVSIVNEGSIEERELLNEEFDREMGDQA